MTTPEDRQFYDIFQDNMNALGLPCPETLYGSLGVALATAGGILNALGKVGPDAAMREVFRSIPLSAWGASAAGSAAVIGGLAEAVAVVGGLSAAFYAGAVIGSLMVAATEMGLAYLQKVTLWAVDACGKTGIRLGDFLDKTIRRHPALSPIRPHIAAANRISPAKQYRRRIAFA